MYEQRAAQYNDNVMYSRAREVCSSTVYAYSLYKWTQLYSWDQLASYAGLEEKVTRPGEEGRGRSEHPNY